MKLRIKTLIAVIVLGMSCSHAWANVLKVAVFSDHYSAISKIFKNKGCVDTDEYIISDNQMLAEFMILCGVLKQTQFNSFELLPYPIMDRALDALSKGEVDVIGFGVWQRDATARQLLVSSALLEPGEFTKGLYSTKNIIEKYAQSGTQHFEELIVVANKNWTHDWTALSCTGLILLHVDRYRQMFSMVAKSRAEFVPLTFGSKPALERKEFGVALYPMPNMKIAFDQSLHFSVSPLFVDGKSLLEALNKGIKKFVSDGKIQRLYENLGLINPKTKNWKVIGC